MADFDWERALLLRRNRDPTSAAVQRGDNGNNDNRDFGEFGFGFDGFDGGGGADAEWGSGEGTRRAGNDDVNFTKTVQNVKMMTGCPSFELCRRVLDQSGASSTTCFVQATACWRGWWWWWWVVVLVVAMNVIAWAGERVINRT